VRYGLRHHPESIAHAADRFDEGAVGVGFDPFAELGDGLVEHSMFTGPAEPTAPAQARRERRAGVVDFQSHPQVARGQPHGDKHPGGEQSFRD
jgi:hypothetical protein